MSSAVRVPVTVKCRIGVDDQDAEADLDRFVDAVADAGCRTFIVHARKAWLKGLSPKENREIPPLDYQRVARLRIRRSGLTIILNGGISSLDEALSHLAWADGVMLGRAAYQQPFLLAGVDRLIYADTRPDPTRREALERLFPYAASHIASGGRLNNIARHVLGLYHGRPGGRAFRRHLSERAVRDGAGVEVLAEALELAEAAFARAAAA